MLLSPGSPTKPFTPLLGRSAEMLRDVPGEHRDNAPDGWDSARFLETVLNDSSSRFVDWFSPAAGTPQRACGAGRRPLGRSSL